MRYAPAIWYPGPASKQGYAGLAVNEGRGVICHSMVGSFEGAKTRLENTLDRVSWHFSVLQSGKVLQHYESNAVCWHAGSKEWNGRLIGIEHEGGPADDNYPLGSPQNNPSEPLTPAQLQASTELVWWLSGAHHFKLLRDGAEKGLYEHREVYQTACPSDRIPWQFYMEDEMTDADWVKLGEIVKAQVYLALLDKTRGLSDQEKRDVAEVVKLELRTTPPLPPQA